MNADLSSQETAVKAIVFDYGGVLRRDDRAEFEAVDEAAGLPRGSLWTALHDIPEYRLSREGKIDLEAFRTAVRAQLARATGLGEARAKTTLDVLDLRLAALPPIERDMHGLLILLRAGGRVKLGLLTNGGPGSSNLLRDTGVAALFDDAIFSADVGFAKPDPAVFKLAAVRLGVEPASCLVVDDQAHHLEGARTAGLRTHLFRRGGLADLLERLEKEGALPRA